jgi:flagellar biosynthetic protein FlhB
MAQQADGESRTEEPTEKKILDEFEKGNIPVSREASVFAATIAMLAITAFMARDIMKSVGLTLERLLSNPSGLLLENGADAVSLFNMLVWEIGAPFIPMLATLLMAGLASSFLQHAPASSSIGSSPIGNVYHCSTVGTVYSAHAVRRIFSKACANCSPSAS